MKIFRQFKEKLYFCFVNEKRTYNDIGYVWFDDLDTNVPIEALLKVEYGRCHTSPNRELIWNIEDKWARATVVKINFYMAVIKLHINSLLGINEEKLYVYSKESFPTLRRITTNQTL